MGRMESDQRESSRRRWCCMSGSGGRLKRPCLPRDQPLRVRGSEPDCFGGGTPGCTNSDGLYVEVLVDGRRVDGEARRGCDRSRESGDADRPLQIGDVARCRRALQCGRGLRCSNASRAVNRLRYHGKGELISHFADGKFAMHVPGVAQMQIVQEQVTQFRFRVVRSRLWRAQRQPAQRSGPWLASGRTPELEFVEQIPQEPPASTACISKVLKRYDPASAS